MTQDPRPPGSIRDLCSAWRTAATAEGGISIGGASEQFRLHRNSVRCHDLSYDELREAVVGLTEILLLPGMNTVIDLDHSLLWCWLGELLVGRDGPLSPSAEREISRLAEVALRAALANVRPPTEQAFEEARAAFELLDNNSGQLLQNAHAVLPYVAFPLLEAVCRRACSTYLDLRGIVLQPFPQRNRRLYDVGRRCSSVADALSLLVDTVAAPQLASDLREMLEHIATFGSSGDYEFPPDGYAVLFEWRNSSLHGEASLTTIGGTVLSLALLIALDALRADYPQHRANALSRGVREVQTAKMTGRWSPSPWSYYPPFP